TGLDAVGNRGAPALGGAQHADLELLPPLPDVLHDDLAQLGPRQRRADVRDRGGGGEPDVHHRSAGEIDTVVEPAVQVDRHEADQDERPGEDQHLEAQTDEVDAETGRDELEEPVLDGRRLLRAGGWSRRHGSSLHTLTVVNRRRDMTTSYTTRV